ncbi:putative enzyme related to lactoylglutathione lyase [Saccharothrix carnea]|uniref:Putative enzyme related to lactoylglutathione lyase n=1 Tax=Saccharothrix carnea TaxID=1280637 RepID=A0A2P8IJM0_SACCR|nr:VOC family protein [Saccharothrix carnea]PSL58658.1 putative enzyme related to lactoylglutathione lyase [Saccharothrix carnea]
MAKVTGIGGVFLRARNPDRMAEWYRKHLGVPMSDGGAITFHWGEAETTTFALFANDTDYFGEPGQRAMINLRVDDLTELLAQLRSRGVEVLPQTEDSEYGRFGWCVDPEGNRIELWQPAAGM